MTTLTAVEFTLLRKILGFTQESIAKFLKVNEKTIWRWENGGKPSKNASERLLETMNQIDLMLDAFVYQIENECQKSESEIEVYLLIYPDNCYTEFAKMGDLPNGVHRALIARIYNEITQRGYQTAVVEFELNSYMAYIADHGFKDSQDARAAWAAFQRKKTLN